MNAAPAPVAAAGTLVWRPSTDDPTGIDVLAVHRPKYDDWSLPKGKLDAREHIAHCAVRETLEETGHRIRLGVPLSTVRYTVGSGALKTVHYWAARGDTHATPWIPTREIDRVEFIPATRALKRLSYAHDRTLVREGSGLLGVPPRDTAPLVLLRHPRTTARADWKGADLARPLTADGQRTAEELVAPLGAFGLRRLLSAPTTRCQRALTPYAAARGLRIVPDARLDPEVVRLQHSSPALAPGFRRSLDLLVRGILADATPTVVCTHGSVLPALISALQPFAALDLPTGSLRHGGFVVLHHHDGQIVAAEVHDRRPAESRARK